MVDDHALKIVGIGAIKIKMYDDTTCTIHEVWYVKGLKNNLFSLGSLMISSLKLKSKFGIMRIVNGVLVIVNVDNISS